jgi:hypothetical protein
MRKLLLTAAALGALACPAYAGALSISILDDASAVPQSASAPCIICATQQAHNPIDFGFNNFINTGQTDGGNFFSTALVGGSLPSGDEVNAVPYSAGQIITALADRVTFGVVIDVNSAEGAPAMTLDTFRLWRVDGSNNNIQLLSFFDGPYSMPDIRPGNGKGDYLLTGFDLSGLNVGDRLIFQAQFEGGSDGGESFYIVPLAVPGPIVGAGIPGVLAGCLGLVGLGRWRRRRAV